MKKNVLVITGSRAEYGIFRSTLNALKESQNLSFNLLVTGMHTLPRFGNTINDIRQDRFPIVAVVPTKKNDDMLTSLTKEIQGIRVFCLKKHIDCILVLGDRDEAFAGAIVAGHLGIPLAHIHGGDRTGRTIIDDALRNAITQFATFHFAATKKSGSRIAQMRGGKKNIFIVGAPGLDEIQHLPPTSRKNIARTFSLDSNQRWIIVVVHPEPFSRTSIKKQVASVLQVIQNVHGEKVIVYPNSDTGSDDFIHAIETLRDKPNIHIYPSIQQTLFQQLLKESALVVGNSSLGIIEAAVLHLPVINIGNRQDGRERAKNVITVPFHRRLIKKAVETALSPSFVRKCRSVKNIYGDGTAGKRIVEVLEKVL